MTEEYSGIISRRNLIAGASAVALASQAGCAASNLTGGSQRLAQTKSQVLDPNNPEHARQIVRKLRYRTDDGYVFAALRGVYLGPIDGVLTPFYGINMGAMQKIEQQEDGTMKVTAMELSFRVNPETGRRDTPTKNPYTNEAIELPVSFRKPTVLTVSADNGLELPSVIDGTRYSVNHFRPTTEQIGDSVFVRDRTYVDVEFADGVQNHLNEVSTLSGPASQVLAPNVTNVMSKLQSNDTRTWPRWLNMNGQPGMLTLFGNGYKCEGFDEMPSDWLEIAEQYAPEFVKDPIGYFEQNTREVS